MKQKSAPPKGKYTSCQAPEQKHIADTLTFIVKTSVAFALLPNTVGLKVSTRTATAHTKLGEWTDQDGSMTRTSSGRSKF